MKANERRMEILEALCERRREQVANLAFEFGVTEWTIRQDILTLSLSYPVYTVQGHGGGVYIADGYRLGKKYFSQKQSEFLERIAEGLTGEDLEMMKGILKTFKEPKRGNK